MEDEKKKGLSLRKKRSVKPKISAPKQISGPLPQGLAAPSANSTNPRIDGDRGRGPSPNPSERSGASSRYRDGSQVRSEKERRPGMGGDKTSDLVKRRYSTRFTQLPTDFSAGAPPVPGVPQIPSHFATPPASRDGRPQDGAVDGEGRRIKVDARALRDPNLRPEQYVASLLADASEQDIMNYQQDLRKVKNRTSTDLQHNVYQNRTQFIKISKEAEKLKGEMRTLRMLMSDLTGALGQATSAGGAQVDALTARKQANRSSVANLEALWNTHLQTLWKRVEGSQKYLPAIPGRHIVYESGRWLELNAATWKARRRVHLILLNDHLLVASEKKRAEAAPQGPREIGKKQGLPQVQLVAQRCWPLQDVHMADLSTRSGAGGRDDGKEKSANAINVRVGTESCTFATGSSEMSEKNTLLSTFRKTVEDLRKTLEAETEERGKAQDSVNYFATRDLSILKKTDLLESLTESTATSRSSMFVDVDGKQQNIRQVESQLDDLDIDIALQRFEAAVQSVEKLKRLAKNIRGNSVAQEIVTFKVNERAAKLAATLTKQLVETHHWMTSTRKHVDWLVRLGFEDRAREAYLEARSATIRKRTRQCIFDGDLPTYIYQLSFIYFTIIRNTISIYQSCFPTSMMSAAVKWAKDHVEEFNVTLARQLSSVDPESEIWRGCVARAKESAEMLRDVGLDFKDLVANGVGNPEALEEETEHGALGIKS